MKFSVYAELVQEVTKKLERLSKKATKYGVPFSYAVGEAHPQKIAVREVDLVTQTIQTVNTYVVEAVDIEVECDGLIRANGWTVRAKVEHGDKGNIVTTFGDYTAKPEWFTAAPHCDHCQTNRFRSVTFFAEHEDGSMRQVGRTCLKDYTGISPAIAAMWAEVQDLVDTGMDCTRDEWEKRGLTPMHNVPNILAHACDVIKEYGYRKKDDPNSTRDMVKQRVISGRKPSGEGLERAELVNSWLVSLEDIVRAEDVAIADAWKKFEETGEDSDNRAYWKLENSRTSSMERNCIALALSGYAKSRHVGLLSYMPVAYDRYMERKARKEQRREADARSDYVGTVGQRIILKAATVTLLSSWDGYYGTTWMYKFVDESGNVDIWFSSRPCAAEDGATIKATVKDHNERDGVKQTILTRCLVLM